MALQPEPRYAFRDRLRTVHRPGRRDPEAAAAPAEVVIDDRWRIVVPADADPLLDHAARDLQDHLRTSMGVSLAIGPDDGSHPGPVIRIRLADGTDASDGRPGDDERAHTIDVGTEEVVLTGRGPKGAARAAYHLEDLLNLRGGPYLTPGRTTREPRFGVRMTHSGYGLDEFPDEYLAQLAHQGMDAILLFVSAPDRTPDGTINRDPAQHSKGRHQRFAEIADRAARHGLDTYLYAYFHSDRPVHPDDPGAERFYEETYGSVFAVCPQAKGIVLVGESVEFPSHDQRTTGRMRLDPVPGGLPDPRPSPGWWPCEDYPQWVSLVRDSCRKYAPDAEIIFWTYNWGWAPEAERLALINALPEDVTVQATFEMFEKFSHDGVTNTCVDYTASRVGPGPYFASEAAAAHARGLRLGAQANTGGLSWDFGVIPYQPIPQHWAKRHAAINRAREDWGLTVLMENHHYGYWPSIVGELASSNYHSPAPEPDDFLAAVARRDFGPGADAAIAGWRAWSEAITDYVPTNADQYGPFRIGPSYPMTLFTNPRPIAQPEAMFGDRIVTTPYNPDIAGHTPKTAPIRRVPAEITSLQRMLTTWRSGTEHLAAAAAAAPDRLRDEADRMVNLGRYVEHCLTTTIHTKQWWLAKGRLLQEPDPTRAEAILDELRAIGEAEYANAEAAIGCTELDSRLGWEPSMEYLGDATHIRWKLAHLRNALDVELPRYAVTVHA
ncbi:hypothetical protein ACQBAU_16945 [Propionibacteriaceae bacterium Y2011]